MGRAGIVANLVVRGERGKDQRRSALELSHQGGGGHVHERPLERWAHHRDRCLATDLAQGERRRLPSHDAHEARQCPVGQPGCDIQVLGQVGQVAHQLPGQRRTVESCGREDDPGRASGVEVGDAGPTVGQQVVRALQAVGEDARLLAVQEVQQLARLAVPPAEGRDVAPLPMQQAGLRHRGRTGGRGPPAADGVRAALDETPDEGHGASLQRETQHRLRESIDLHDHEAGCITSGVGAGRRILTGGGRRRQGP